MPYSGTLITQVTTSRGQIPVPDASVFVVQRRANGDQLLAVLTSDASGNTPPLAIQAPAPAGSEIPGVPHPFALCDIWAEHREYQLLTVRDVQIFPGVVSVQNLSLIPLAPGMGTDTVTIPAQDL